MKQLFTFLSAILLFKCALAQNVGIGTSTPDTSALLHIDLGVTAKKGFLVTGIITSNGTVPNLGAGPRLMFYPAKVAFRAGYTDGNSWSNTNVGSYSAAMGNSTIAKGNFSTAMGSNTTASGVVSTAMGASTKATGDYSTAAGNLTTAGGKYSTAMGWSTSASGISATAMGKSTIATNDNSTAMGSSTTASGFASTAMGSSTTASNTNSTAMGNLTTANGTSSTAMGLQTTANGSASVAMGTGSEADGNSSFASGIYSIAAGNYSTAMGFQALASGEQSTAIGAKVSTNNKKGAFVIGDSDPGSQGFAEPGLTDLFVARFNAGYYLYTSGVTANIGVAINHNGNAWVSACDKNLKENFQPLDGEDVLNKLSKISFTSWNYKKQDPKIYRHYGIMAQDFYTAFGQDKYGTIGNDSTVNPIDMIGIDMTAIQALEKRTAALQSENEALKSQASTMNSRNEILNNEVAALNERLKKVEELLSKKM